MFYWWKGAFLRKPFNAVYTVRRKPNATVCRPTAAFDLSLLSEPGKYGSVLFELQIHIRVGIAGGTLPSVVSRIRLVGGLAVDGVSTESLVTICCFPSKVMLTAALLATVPC